MKRIAVVTISLLLLTACSTTRFVDSWRNNEITDFKPEKLLVVGMTNNLTARKIFEEELKNALKKRNINAYESTMVLDRAFTDSEKSQAEIDTMKDQLIKDGFDAVMITAVIGVDDRRAYRSGYYTYGFYRWYRFGPYYYRFQNIYYTPEYYEDYKVYHIETSIYNLREDQGSTLVWVGTFDITDPVNITSTVDDYVERITLQLEQEGLVEKLYYQ